MSEMTLEQRELHYEGEPTEDEIRSLAETATATARRHVREELVYQYDDGKSYFMDLWKRSESTAANERMERHERQMLDIPKTEKRMVGADYETRVNPNLEEGHGKEFTIPLWLNQLFVVSRRPGEIIAKLVREAGSEFDLPEGCSSINVTRITTGTTVSGQVPGGPAPSQDVETATVKAQSVVYTGISDWSIQALEQSPKSAHLDWAIFKEMTLDLFSGLEELLITGKGENFSQPLGLQEISGTNAITWTTVAPSGTSLVPELGKALAQSGTKRKRPPEAILMNSGRWFWLATSEDSVNHPLDFTDYPDQDWPIVGFAGVGIYLNDNIPNTFGANKEQDAIFVCRPSDMFFWHSQAKTAVQEDVLSGTMQVRFRLHRTSACMMHRFPTAISKIEGTGLKVQTGFS